MFHPAPPPPPPPIKALIMPMWTLVLFQDILHPLATISWEKLTWPAKHNLQNVLPSSVLLDGKLYYGVHALRDTSYIYAVTTDLKSWSSLRVPNCLRDFTLTTYHSQLVLVGGRLSGDRVCSDLCVYGDGDWLQSLPSMLSPRYRAGAVNTQNPEYLVVAGGNGSDRSPLDTVEVLIENQWFSLQSLPKPRKLYNNNITSVIHNGNVYLMNGFNTDYCTLKSLFGSCGGLARTGKFDRDAALWKTLRNVHQSYPVQFGRQLVVMCESGELNAFSPLTRCWVYVESFPRSEFFSESAIVIPNGDLVLIGISGLLKGALKGIYSCEA